MLDNWNKNTNVWLRECVYKRVTPKGKKPGFRSTMLTFGTSAFWHGIAGGYYMAFFLGGFVQTAGRLCRSNLRPLFLQAPSQLAPSIVSEKQPMRRPEPPPTSLKPLYDAAGVICSVLILNFAAAPFMVQSIRDSLTVWRQLDFYGLWMVGGCLVFFWSGGAKLLRPTKRPVPRAEVTTPSTPGTPGSHVIPPVDETIKEVEKRLR
jgi:lysophospholipid acyltransferase